MLDLSGSKNPSFSFFMFHWKNEDVEADGGKTKISIEISVDGGAFKQIGEDITAGFEKEGWGGIFLWLNIKMQNRYNSV